MVRILSSEQVLVSSELADSLDHKAVEVIVAMAAVAEGTLAVVSLVLVLVVTLVTAAGIIRPAKVTVVVLPVGGIIVLPMDTLLVVE